MIHFCFFLKGSEFFVPKVDLNASETLTISSLQSELLVEKYLSGQYLKKIRDLHKKLVARDTEDNQRQALVKINFF